MFKEKTIGDRLNTILKNNGEDVFCGVSFEEAVKNSSRVFINICTLNKVYPDKTDIIVNPYTGKSELVEDWIAFIHRELLGLFQFGFQFTEDDLLVLDFIKTALMVEYNEIYYDFFD